MALTRLRTLLDPERSALPYIPWLAGSVFRAAPVEASLNLAGVLLSGMAPAATLVGIRRVIDIVAHGLGVAALEQPLLWLAGVMVISEIASAVVPVTNNRMQEKLAPYMQELLLHKAASLSLAQFDDPETYNLIERSSQTPGGRVGRLWMRISVVSRLFMTAVSAGVLIVAFSPSLAALALLIAIPVAWVGVRNAKRMYGLSRRQTQSRRRSDYLAGLMADRPSATELRAYQLLPFFLKRWRDAFIQRRDEYLVARRIGGKEGGFADLATILLMAGSLALVAYLAGGSPMAAGQLVVLAQSVRMMQESINSLATMSSDVLDDALPLIDLRKFLALPGGERPGNEGKPFPDLTGGAIRFESVSFRYPGKAEPALADVTLEIPAGQTVALVGANGAGKSTLIKLLLGLYPPTTGRVTYGGVTVAEIAPNALRQNVSCIFQDFARYDLTVGDNVGVGRIGATPEEVSQAGHAAGLDAMIAGLPEGYETLLGKTFKGGKELSGGQWQRVALGRAFVRNAQVIVLDEPTAALDARAELELFGRFVDLFRGRTALLISHRLGSARLADQIIVMDGGQVAEVGTHEELLARDGIYAKLFHSQAQWYEATEGEVVL